MRLWSIHPCYLDSKGLVALWREALLAKNVLEGRTKAYLNHPQLERFKSSENPVSSINVYLQEVYNEAVRRGYNFSKEKTAWNLKAEVINVTQGQVDYETQHLLNKLMKRDKNKYNEIISLKKYKCHPLFRVIEGDIEKWEIIKT